MTWVCGADEWLRYQVVTDLVGRYADNGGAAWYDLASASGLRAFWADAFQYEIATKGETPARCIVGTRADKASDWTKLELWAEQMRTMPKLYLIFDSADPKIESDQPHVAMMRDKGDVIRCAQPKEADTFEWLEGEFPNLRVGVLNAVISHTANDPRRAWQVCQKLALFGDCSPEHVPVIAGEHVAGEFVDYVVLGDMKRAMKLAQQIEPRKVLGMLDARLRQMQELHRAYRTSTRPHVPVFVERRFERVAGRYNQTKVAKARRLLVSVDEATRRGDAVGALEMLVRLW